MKRVLVTEGTSPGLCHRACLRFYGLDKDEVVWCNKLMDEKFVSTTQSQSMEGRSESGVPTNGSGFPAGPILPELTTPISTSLIAPTSTQSTDIGSTEPSSTVPDASSQPAIQDGTPGSTTPSVANGESQTPITPGTPGSSDGTTPAGTNGSGPSQTQGSTPNVSESSVNVIGLGAGRRDPGSPTKKKRFFKRNTQGSQNVPPSTPPGKNSFWQRLRPAHYIVVGIVAMALAATGLAVSPTLAPRVVAPTPTIVQPIASPSASFTLPQISTVKRGRDSLYPNSSLTPGAILPATKQQVCQPDYTTTVRDVSDVTKNEVFAEYSIPQSARTPGAYEVDHFVPLELGGSNDITNLWPEPALPVPGFHQKDLAENYLHEQVCSGKMTLADAQKEITTDWYQVYLQMPH